METILRACLAGLVTRGSFRKAGAVLAKPIYGFAKTTLTPLLFTQNGFSRKTFGRAPLERPEPEPERSPTKQALITSPFVICV